MFMSQCILVGNRLLLGKEFQRIIQLTWNHAAKVSDFSVPHLQMDSVWVCWGGKIIIFIVLSSYVQ